MYMHITITNNTYFSLIKKQFSLVLIYAKWIFFNICLQHSPLILLYVLPNNPTVKKKENDAVKKKHIKKMMIPVIGLLWCQ